MAQLHAVFEGADAMCLTPESFPEPEATDLVAQPAEDLPNGASPGRVRSWAVGAGSTPGCHGSGPMLVILLIADRPSLRKAEFGKRQGEGRRGGRCWKMLRGEPCWAPPPPLTGERRRRPESCRGGGGFAAGLSRPRVAQIGRAHV